MTNNSYFGAGQARGSSPLAHPRPTPAARGELPRLWIPTATRATATGRRNIPVGARGVDIIDIAALSFPEEFLPIVRGLALGKPDVTVSRLLDMSPRTFSRRVAEFLAYLEIETRFQAGIEVARRWMLPPSEVFPASQKRSHDA